jgi:hypothetical protein
MGNAGLDEGLCYTEEKKTAFTQFVQNCCSSKRTTSTPSVSLIPQFFLKGKSIGLAKIRAHPCGEL